MQCLIIEGLLIVFKGEATPGNITLTVVEAEGDEGQDREVPPGSAASTIDGNSRKGCANDVGWRPASHHHLVVMAACIACPQPKHDEGEIH